MTDTTGTSGTKGATAAVTFDTALFKEALGRFVTGVTVVTALEEGRPVGFTCQSFVSLSLDPPLVALAPAKSSTSWPRIAKAGSLCVNVLGDHQQEVCRKFAVSGGDKFAGISWHRAEIGGAPIIDGSLAWVNCSVELIHDAGDHELVIGRVLDIGLGEGSPLLYYRSAFNLIAETRGDATDTPARPGA
ncbi:MAG TPA: flavin reductase family protein [Acidimicrobiales bacterium]|jgi:flavin reductase (DIM6/NTAB) family NADH-FMN oxidoreductase RutF|nr:flavin reductase family protein [Acidimicrobiales bacterium]